MCSRPFPTFGIKSLVEKRSVVVSRPGRRSRECTTHTCGAARVRHALVNDVRTGGEAR
jgi:hypothetical protein